MLGQDLIGEEIPVAGKSVAEAIDAYYAEFVVVEAQLRIKTLERLGAPQRTIEEEKRRADPQTWAGQGVKIVSAAAKAHPDVDFDALVACNMAWLPGQGDNYPWLKISVEGGLELAFYPQAPRGAYLSVQPPKS